MAVILALTYPESRMNTEALDTLKKMNIKNLKNKITIFIYQSKYIQIP